MKPYPDCHGIIPARYGSSRFPGKPLADIHGKPMFWHVYNRALQCPELKNVTLATDDKQIAEAAERLHVPFVMTRSDHQSGTDRVKEAADRLNLAPDAVIVNIQGDEPLLEPEVISMLIAPFSLPHIKATTVAHPIDPKEAGNPDRVKVVFDSDGRALYFSRFPIPYCRDRDTDVLRYGHVGLYAFRKEILDRFVSLHPSRLEKVEKLEQLRLLENGIPLHVVITEKGSISVDRPEDLAAVLSRLQKTAEKG